MSSEIGLVLASIALILGNAFFVAAEYALVSARRSRIEGMARKGSRTAKALMAAMADMSPYIAGIQIAITMFGIGIGSVTEPFIRDLVQRGVGASVPTGVSAAFSLLLATYLTVVFGELVPKYVSLRAAERIALAVIVPLTLFITLLRPLVWLVQSSGSLVLRLFRIKPADAEGDVMAKEELLTLVRTGGAAGVLEKTHAEMVTRALRFDVLDAQDVMVHRLDIKWLDVSFDREQTLQRLRKIPYNRIPVCRGDIDDLVGIAYLHDIILRLDDPDFNLEKIARPVVAVPENLSLEKIVETMRSEKIQMLVVMDEYGGTSGLVTLEDVVEEVFGELEDRLESERPPIEVHKNGRISAKADVRFDELVSRLELELDPGENTDTLATMIVDALERVPKPGDTVETDLGTLRVENMARRRITRVSVFLRPELQRPSDEA